MIHSSERKLKMRNSTLLIVVAIIITLAPCANAKKKDKERLFWGKTPPVYVQEPHAIQKGELVKPPGQHQYFPVRDDGQDFVLNIDQTVNLTHSPLHYIS